MAKAVIQGKVKAVDIKNSFKLQISEYLTKIVKNYTSDRTLWYETDNGTEYSNISAELCQE